MSVVPSEERAWNRYRWIDWVLLALITTYFLRGWLQAGVPLSPRLEMLPGVSLAGRVRLQLLQDRLFYEWDPYEFAGYPWTRFLSFPLYTTVGVFSAVTGLSLRVGMTAVYLIAFALSAVVMYEWVHAVTGRRTAALVAGVVYSIFPYHLHTGIEWWEHALFWAILPLPYALYERGRSYLANRGLDESAVAGGKVKCCPHWIWMGLVVGLYPVVNIDRTVISVLCLVIYIAVRESQSLIRRQHRLGDSILSLALSVLVSAGVGACVLVPAAIELPRVGLHLKRGTASLVSEELLSEYAISPRLLVAAILRRLHRPVTTANLPEVWDAFGGFNTWYLGVVALLLSAFGVLRIRKSSVATLAGVLWLWGLLIAMGPRVPVNPVRFLPFIGSLRFQPHRGMMVVALAEAMLAAQGLVWIAERLTIGDREKQQHWWLLALCVLLVGLIIVDFRPGEGVFRTRSDYFTDDEIEAYQWLAREGEGFRMWDYALAPRDQYLYTLGILEAPVPRFWGYYDNGAPLHAFSLFNWGDQAVKLDLNAVRYVLLRPDAVGHAEVAEDLKRMGYSRVSRQSGQVLVMENPEVGPYVRTYAKSALYVGDPQVGGLSVLPALLGTGVALVCGPSAYLEDYSVETLLRHDYVLLNEALVRKQGTRSRIERVAGVRIVEDPKEVVPAQGSQTAASGSLAALEPRLVEGGTGPEVIRVMVDAYRPQVLMVSESWYPNWHVYVDGEPEELLRVNYAFLGVQVSPGRHRVEFRYEIPWYTTVSYAVGGLTLLMFVGWVSLRGKRRSPRG